MSDAAASHRLQQGFKNDLRAAGLKLSTRVWNGLQNFGVCSLDELLNVDLAALSKLSNFGKKSLAEAHGGSTA